MSKTGTLVRYSDAVWHRILDRLGAGEMIHHICQDKDMPSRETVRLWLKRWDARGEDGAAHPLHANVGMYARAEAESWHAMAAECVSIADDSSQDTDSLGKQNSEWINRSRLRVDTRKWLLSKRCGAYADRLDINMSAKVQVMQAFVDITPTPAKESPTDIEVLPHVSVPDGAQEDS